MRNAYLRPPISTPAHCASAFNVIRRCSGKRS